MESNRGVTFNDVVDIDDIVGVSRFSLSDLKFIEIFVSVGALIVRDLFNKAKDNLPYLVFIDEIDVVGRQRGTGIGGGNDEREQTLNQLLIKWILLVTVGLPYIRGREEILKVCNNNKRLKKDVSFGVIAMRTSRFSGTDLANLKNEIAILTGRRGKDNIKMKEINDLNDRIIAGMEGN